MSNNSIVLNSKPSKEKLKEIFDRIRYNGEPGFWNREAALKRRPNVKGTNPCSEILLDSKGFCNLSTVVVTSHVNASGGMDVGDLLRSVQLATFIGTCVTNVTVELPEWDRIQKRDRLTGVSMTGFMDAIDRMGLSFKAHYVKALLNSMRNVAHEAADKYAYEMRIPRPLLVTCVKPEGTISQLATCSSGLHRSHAPYYIRRVRYSETDPVAKAFDRLGFKGYRDPKKTERIIYEFPIATGAKLAADDESALDQFERYELFMDEYVDHNASCTLTLSPDEHPAVIDTVYEKWDKIVGIAWLPKAQTAYENPPYQAISKDEYDRRVSVFPDLSSLVDVVNKVEQNYYEFELEEPDAVECPTGQCPMR